MVHLRECTLQIQYKKLNVNIINNIETGVFFTSMDFGIIILRPKCASSLSQKETMLTNSFELKELKGIRPTL